MSLNDHSNGNQLQSLWDHFDGANDGFSSSTVPSGKALSATPSSSSSPLHTLSLNKEAVLDTPIRRLFYHIIETCTRILPALVIYGGTISLLICVFCKYRWGVFLSLMLYTFYMFLNSWALVIFSGWGMLKIYVQSRNDWSSMWTKLAEKENAKSKDKVDKTPSSGEETSQEIRWNDVFHVVVIPNYRIPEEVLHTALRAFAKFSLARTNLGVCLACEESEDGVVEKAQKIREVHKDNFAFVTFTLHPANLPNHVPGKSSNVCWAFKELQNTQMASSLADPRVVVTVIDGDSELHENYFEALTYHFLEADECQRYLTIWQPPIVHFKNLFTQSLLLRIASLFTSLHQLSCLSNPGDCHVPFSSYSISLILAASVGGWDPDFISQDWHMMAKCTLMTEGRARCQPIFLPLLNYAPEEETCTGTIQARWAQATRHALGVIEIVYMASNLYVGMVEAPTLSRSILFLWRMLPMLYKFISVHFVIATLAVWPLLAHILINIYMWRSWCNVGELGDTCANCCVSVAAASDFGIGQERVILNSWMVYFQRQANSGLALGLVLAGGVGSLYIQVVKDRIDGDPSTVSNPLLLWFRVQAEVMLFGWAAAMAFGSMPEWIAVVRIMTTLRFHQRGEEGGL